jgi:hypothetical protein
MSAWCWLVTISSAKVCPSSWLGAFAFRNHATFSSWFCVLSHGVTHHATFVLSLQVIGTYFPFVQKKVIILHFSSSSSSLWHWYNKFANDWCVFWGGLGEYTVSFRVNCVCVVSVGKLMFSRLLVVVCLLLTLPFTLTFSVVYRGEFIPLIIYWSTKIHGVTHQKASVFRFVLLMTLIYRVIKG